MTLELSYICLFIQNLAYFITNLFYYNLSVIDYISISFFIDDFAMLITKSQCLTPF